MTITTTNVRLTDYADLSVRTQNCLTLANLDTLADVLKAGEKLMTYRNFGRKSAAELAAICYRLGHLLGSDRFRDMCASGYSYRTNGKSGGAVMDAPGASWSLMAAYLDAETAGKKPYVLKSSSGWTLYA